MLKMKNTLGYSTLFLIKPGKKFVAVVDANHDGKTKGDPIIKICRKDEKGKSREIPVNYNALKKAIIALHKPVCHGPIDIGNHEAVALSEEFPVISFKNVAAYFRKKQFPLNHFGKMKDLKIVIKPQILDKGRYISIDGFDLDVWPSSSGYHEDPYLSCTVKRP